MAVFFLVFFLIDDLELGFETEAAMVFIVMLRTASSLQEEIPN